MSRQLTCVVNGETRRARVRDHWSLNRLLRAGLGLTGTPEPCGTGWCGACTVSVDERQVLACLYLARRAAGRHIRTVEGLAEGGELNSLQEAFLRHGAVQCGYCTPGMLMALEALLREQPSPTRAQIRAHMSGNICRCGCYDQITEAVLATLDSPATRHGHDPPERGDAASPPAVAVAPSERSQRQAQPSEGVQPA